MTEGRKPNRAFYATTQRMLRLLVPQLGVAPAGPKMFAPALMRPWAAGSRPAPKKWGDGIS